MNVLHFYQGNEWDALFVNGELAEQDNIVGIDRLNAHCPISKVVFDYIPGHVEEWLLENGPFPNNLHLMDMFQLQPAKEGE